MGTIYGSYGNDDGISNPEINGTDASDILHGLKGNDQINAGWNNGDILFGDDGNDTLHGSSANHTFVGGHGDDMINAFNGPIDTDYIDTAIYYGKATDYDISWPNVDIILGNFSGLGFSFPQITIADKIGQDGVDQLYGVDILKFKDATLYWNGHGYGTQIKFTFGDDSVSGWSNSDEINGRSGNDYIKGNAGEDLLYGGAGNDKVDGGDDTDYILGGDGNDRLIGGKGADYLIDDLGINTLRGGEGNDSLNSNSKSSCYLLGESGDDFLSAGTGKHFVSGGEGDDKLLAGSGSQRLYGDAGNDKFFFYNDLMTGNHVIKDFTIGEDVVVIRDRPLQNFDYIQSHMSSNSVGDTVIILEAGGRFTIEGISPDMLHQSDFLFTV